MSTLHLRQDSGYSLTSGGRSERASSRLMLYHTYLKLVRTKLKGPAALELLRSRAFSIQQKFQFEILEILRAKWKGTSQLPRHSPSHCTFGYCFCKQDTKEQYWVQQFCQKARNISVQPTKMTRLVKVDHLQS